MSYKLSVIVVVYNDHQGIQRTLESILRTKLPEIQLIVVDGNSTDGTLEYLNGVSDSIDNLVIEEKPSGVYGAMNNALDQVKAPYHIFINSSDEVRMDLADIADGGACFIPVNIQRHFHKTEHPWGSPKKRDYFGMPYCHQGIIFPSGKFRFDTRYKICADYDYYLQYKAEFAGKDIKPIEGYIFYDAFGLSNSFASRWKSFAEERQIIRNYFGSDKVFLHRVRFLVSFAWKKIKGHYPK